MIGLTPPLTDPTELYRYRDRVYADDLLIAAVADLDLFTWLAEYPSDLDGICDTLGLARRPAIVMLRLLGARGLVGLTQGVYRLTNLAREHLVSGSPFGLGPYYGSLRQRPTCQQLLDVLRTDQPASWSGQDQGRVWEEELDDAAGAAQLTAAMDCRGAYLGPMLAERLDLTGSRRLLDVAGGSGIYACLIAVRHPHLEAVVLERPPVDAIARRRVEETGLSERVTVATGDMFQAPLPAGCDVHLYSNVLHDWGEEKVRSLLQKSHDALEPGGLLAVHDTHLDADGFGPLAVAEYSALLMHGTEGRCYGVDELSRFLADAGFTYIGVAPTGADRSVVTARRR
ncbi:MAG TPA: methyltransferase [Candidatus Dormibacteraeota bacterium]|jgi:SAM-dependent methyltransferase|nr:methyltransferase [Candidatus Dormibacteraeota bacterium]